MNHRALFVLCLAWLSGCVAVRPTERELLADPVMVLERERDMQRMQGHIYEVREASRGGLALEGAGCGCN